MVTGIKLLKLYQYFHFTWIPLKLNSTPIQVSSNLFRHQNSVNSFLIQVKSPIKFLSIKNWHYKGPSSTLHLYLTQLLYRSFLNILIQPTDFQIHIININMIEKIAGWIKVTPDTNRKPSSKDATFCEPRQLPRGRDTGNYQKPKMLYACLQLLKA